MDDNNSNGLKKIGLLSIFSLISLPVFIFFVVIFTAAMFLLGFFKDKGFDFDFGDLVSNNGSCSYKVDGKEVSDVKVRLLDCAGNTPVSGEQLVDFEKYITGVVYQEIGDAHIEALKAQAVAARSYALTRAKSMNGAYGISLEKENDQWILSLRSCTNDQVYCDPDNGCWSNRTGGQTSNSNPGDWSNCTVHSGYDSSKTWSRGPLAQDSKIRQAVKDTEGQVLVDSSGNVVATSFVNTNQQNWISMADQGKDYFEILIADYGSGNKLSNSNCTSSSSGNIDTNITNASVAEIVKWDQSTAWNNLIGTPSNEFAPYLSQSFTDTRMTSIDVPMRKWTGSGSNPRKDTSKVMQNITINAALAPLWKAFYEDVYENAPDFVIGTYDGCYFYKIRTSGGSLSAHSYGAACDLNANTSGNGYGETPLTESQWKSLPDTREKYQVVYKGSKVIQIAHKYTLANGSDWDGGGHDAMHFSFIADNNRADNIACQGKVSCS